MNLTQSSEKIKHVVLLALENRSFDQMLGGMQEKIPTLDGVNSQAASRFNKSKDGKIYEQNKIYDKQIGFDPNHEFDHVAIQLKGGNQGFILDFEAVHPESTEQDRNHIMGYYPPGFLPALHTLSEHFCVCDQWHSSVPGPTWPNRNFLLSGTTLGKIRMPIGKNYLNMAVDQTQDTIFDRLNEKNISWKVYYHDFPCSFLLRNQQKKENRARYFDFQQFIEDAKNESIFPEFCFIEPRYYGKEESDDHPPHNIMKGQKLIADVYNAIRANSSLWESTLLIVLYDEHGGFYDHVIPPTAVPPGKYENAEFSFDQLGLRVPAILVSPWVKRGVEHTLFDHTSVLRFLIDKWKLSELGDRALNAKSICCALQFDQALMNTPSEIIVTEEQLHTPRPELEDDALSGHNQGLVHAWSVIKDQLGKEAMVDAALSAKDPQAFKRRIYPYLVALGYLLQGFGWIFSWGGAKIVKSYRDFQRSEVERANHEVKTLLSKN